MVVDTSALLAVFFNEPDGPWALDQLQLHRGDLRMCTVNLAETLILLEDRQPQIFDEIRDKILQSSIRFVPPAIKHAEIAASARSRYPINLGDCFAYALAKADECPLLTLDRDFKKTDLTVILPGR